MPADNTCKIHTLDAEASGIELPLRLNDPFDYVPHPLCRAAAGEVLRHLAAQSRWRQELDAGKMFGVLIVRDRAGQVGFLAAFSGNLDGSNRHPYFVPPVFDMLEPDGFFRRGEAAISEINRQLRTLEHSDLRIQVAKNFEEAKREAEARLTAFKRDAERAKSLRDARRSGTTDPALLGKLDDESRREGTQLRRLKEELKSAVEAAQAEADKFDAEIAELKAERRRRSEALQRELFASFVFVNGRGERRDLLKIFADAGESLPPAGAGECAAPKLLQYALLNGLTPLQIAEFWVGRSPKGEVRRHGSYYPACRGKCKPILDFVLQGLDVERSSVRNAIPEPSIIYEDDAIAVILKPAGMLSVEGKVDLPSVEEWARRRFAGKEPKPVHRLDMDVSGLLLIAKDLHSYKILQEQFLRRTVRKRYKALVEGVVAAGEGRISLPLRPDPHDRPRQVIDPDHGKPALTLFKVMERRDDSSTLVDFEPVTGRTHQLRVHAAAAEGLDAPIAGDTLYGAQPAARLYLHNEFIEFDHPVTGQRVAFESPIDF